MRPPTLRVLDPLTGLLDRASFTGLLCAAVARRTPLALVCLDLDRFKLINDSLGHSAGDQLLVAVARRLREAVGVPVPCGAGGALAGAGRSGGGGDGVTLARLGGDEFAVLWTGESALHAGAALVERVRRGLTGTYRLSARPRHVSASIGCRLWVPGLAAADAEALLRDADAAMYAAKAAGGGRAAFFTDAIRTRVVRRVELEQRLRDALDADAVGVGYQPVVDLRDGRLAGVEALLRWAPDDLDDVTPAEVVRTAEESGLIGALGAAVLRRVCRDVAAWDAAGAGPLPVSINVSGLQLADEGFPDLVGDTLAASGVAPSRVCLELTETVVLEPEGVGRVGRVGVAAAALERLRALGVFLAIDDFGTGYSSLGRLRELPVEVLKIDRSFVAGLGTAPHDTAIVASVVSLAHALGLHVVAEGVETPGQAEELRRLGCPVAQGWLFAAALPAEQIAALTEGGTRLAVPAWRREGGGGGRFAGSPLDGRPEVPAPLRGPSRSLGRAEAERAEPSRPPARAEASHAPERAEPGVPAKRARPAERVGLPSPPARADLARAAGPVAPERPANRAEPLPPAKRAEPARPRAHTRRSLVRRVLHQLGLPPQSPG